MCLKSEKMEISDGSVKIGMIFKYNTLCYYELSDLLAIHQIEVLGLPLLTRMLVAITLLMVL